MAEIPVSSIEIKTAKDVMGQIENTLLEAKSVAQNLKDSVDKAGDLAMSNKLVVDAITEIQIQVQKLNESLKQATSLPDQVSAALNQAVADTINSISQTEIEPKLKQALNNMLINIKDLVKEFNDVAISVRDGATLLNEIEPRIRSVYQVLKISTLAAVSVVSLFGGFIISSWLDWSPAKQIFESKVARIQAERDRLSTLADILEYSDTTGISPVGLESFSDTGEPYLYIPKNAFINNNKFKPYINSKNGDLIIPLR